jgi:PAS domain-containing protein
LEKIFGSFGSWDITDERRQREHRGSDFRLQMALAGKLGWYDYIRLRRNSVGRELPRDMGPGPDDSVDINVFWAGFTLTVCRDPKSSRLPSIGGDGHFDGENMVRPLDGSPCRWVHATGQTIFSGEGVDRHAVHVIGTVQDITESKRLEEQLRYLANLVETVSDAIISTDTDLRIQSWNKAAETMYGWKAEEVVGKKGSTILKTVFPEGMSRETLIKYLFVNGTWQGELIQRT